MRTITDIYAELISRNIPIDSHYSDLYVIKNEETIALIDRYEYRQNVESFISAIDSIPMFDIPFAYTPYWENKTERSAE